MNDALPPTAPGPLSRDEFTRRAWIVAGVAVATAGLAGVVVVAAPVFLLLFASILLAILLRAAADAVGEWTGIGPRWGFGVVLTLLVVAGAVAIFFVGATAEHQFAKLSEELPRAAERVRAHLEGRVWGRELLRWAPAARDAVVEGPEGAASPVATLFATTFGAAGNVVVLFFVTLYLAASPEMYLDGAVRLVPRAGRPRAREVLEAVGGRLKGWMLGQLVGMATIGALVGIGLKLAGVPQYFALALVAALFNAIPYVGPIIAAIPGLLAALAVGPATALWALLAYLVAQTVEGYGVTPMVQERTSALPPALILVAIALAGALLGAPGLIVAAPLAVAVKTLVEELYLKDALGDQDAARA